MRVAIITPYLNEPDAWLERCMASVKAQTYAQCTHFLVADGPAKTWLDERDVRHVVLNKPHKDFGNTPRSVGGLLAVSEGYDAIAFLDADNWLEPEHVFKCIEAGVPMGADYVTSGRNLCREDGSIMPIVSSDDGNWSHVDTNCFFLFFGAFHTIARWALMPKPMAILGDRYFHQSLQQEHLKPARSPSKTVNYLCTWSSFYRAIGEPVPAFCKENVDGAPVRAWMARLGSSDLRHVERLTGCSLAPS